MVSIRRRRLLGLCSGRDSFPGPLPRFSDNGQSLGSRFQNSRPLPVHPMPSVDAPQPKVTDTQKENPEPSNPPESSTLKEEPVQPTPGGIPEVKRRKRHRRKNLENQEQCVMRGVYFKNMKWQAAIKVDKKQIHLGTVGSQEEAARLYDRAAFMCGREPNFELSAEEKQELSKFKWEEFLVLTRSAINNKKQQRRVSSRMKFEFSDWDTVEQGGNGFSASEDKGTSPPLNETFHPKANDV